MKIILLSGGSGRRLWPLSNDARSKQFLRLLTAPDGSPESMIQRTVRQIRATLQTDDILVATSQSQCDAIECQLGADMPVVSEPTRRGTFPAIALACAYMADKGVCEDESVVVMPCDTYAGDNYFATIATMTDALQQPHTQLVLMGVRPIYPSEKYGYILPDYDMATGGSMPVKGFREKPDVKEAEHLIEQGAMWSGGVFAFTLGYMLDVMKQTLRTTDYESLRRGYEGLEYANFDYSVVEKATDMRVVPFRGKWKDLGTWNTLTDELHTHQWGNVVSRDSQSSYIINELELPVACIGCRDMVVACSPDGILVSSRAKSEDIKHLADDVRKRPMYEERRWGEYKVIDSIEFGDGFCALTKQLILRPGASISYQRHTYRREVWTFIDGEGEIVLDGVRRPVRRGDVIDIAMGQMHALRAITPLTFIEVQQGTNLLEEDIERFPYEW